MEKTCRLTHFSAQDLISSLQNKVFGQDSAIHTLAMTLQSLPLFEKKAPLTFLFVGKTGIGKKLLAHSLAESLFENKDKLIQIASQATPTSFLDLIIRTSTNEKKYLYDAVKENPNSIIFFEDIDEAFDHLKFLNDLLCHDVFKNVILIISTTLGANIFTDTTNHATSNSSVLDLMQLVLNENPLFSNNKLKDDSQEKLLGILKNYFPANILRQSQIITFNALNHVNIEKILQLKLHHLAETLEIKFQTEFQYAPEVLRYLIFLSDKYINDNQSLDKLFENAVYPIIAHTLFSHVSEPLQKRKIYLSMHPTGHLLKSEFVTASKSISHHEYSV